MPSVLVEVGFLTNANEEAYLGSTKGQDEIASGIFRAFREYKEQIESLN
jgi:N-acetylmuramoyl-L-alanine amidase